MKKILEVLVFLLFSWNILTCSRIHGIGDHCDHVYRLCLRPCPFLQPPHKIAWC